MRSVFVTGASSGIGYATACYLAKSGFRVFAGIRSQVQWPAELKIESIFVDVTKPSELAAAFDKITELLGSSRLFALINNAGVASGGPTHMMNSDQFRDVMEVNFFAVTNIVNRFHCLLETNGKIINLSSVSGQIAFPYLSPYCASKAALSSYGQSLRLELESSGIEVVTVEPTIVQTPIFKKGIAHLDQLERNSSTQAATHADISKRIRRSLTKASKSRRSPDEVAKVISNILNRTRSPATIVIGWDGKFALMLQRLLPAGLFLKFLRIISFGW